MIRRLARFVAGLDGWRRRGFAVLTGAVAAAALPPVFAVPLLVVSFTALVWLTDASRTRRAAFGAGWWFGLGYFLAGLYWIAFAFLVEPEKYAWMIPFALAGLASAVAVYPGLATLAVRLSGATGAGRILMLAAAWTAAEWIRGKAFTGFPWNPLGIVWGPSDAMLQFAALGGVFGLSLVTVLVAASPATLADEGGRRCWLPAAAPLLLGVIWSGGALRLAGAEQGQVPGVVLRLVQANISQTRKWLPELRERHFADYLKLSRTVAEDRVTHLIWPEAATPFVVANDPARRRAMARMIPRGGLLLTGSLRTTPPAATPIRVWNSVHAVDGTGRIKATYDKFHLVPFGEYVPLRWLLRIPKLTMGRTDFSAGPGPRTITLPGLPPVSPLICYEVIFPGAVTDPTDRPGWLLNLTNDAWFGISAGPYQHFASARMRAVEEGLPLVRAANTGISGVIDGYGRIVAQLGLGVRGTLDAPLPRALSTPPPYARFGDLVLMLLIAAVAAAGWIRRRHRTIG